MKTRLHKVKVRRVLSAQEVNLAALRHVLAQGNGQYVFTVHEGRIVKVGKVESELTQDLEWLSKLHQSDRSES